jgi:hypothetical protein
MTCTVNGIIEIIAKMMQLGQSLVPVVGESLTTVTTLGITMMGVTGEERRRSSLAMRTENKARTMRTNSMPKGKQAEVDTAVVAVGSNVNVVAVVLALRWNQRLVIRTKSALRQQAEAQRDHRRQQ